VPRREAAIENGATCVPEPTQHPPEPRGHGAAAVVVGDDHVVGADAPVAERRRETLAVGQRMPALVCCRSSRQVLVEVRVARTGNVAAVVGRPARRRIGQGKTAIDDDPIRATELAR
jgi:hypothetical protein